MSGGPGDQTPPSGSDLNRRTLSGMLWVLLGSGAQQAMQFVVLIALARLLRPQDFGLVNLALVVIGFSAIFVQMGIGTAIVQKQEVTRREQGIGFTLSFCVGIASGLAMWLAAPLVGELLHNEPLNPILRGLSVVFPLLGLSVVPEAMLQRELRFRLLVRSQMASYFIGYVLVGLGCAWYGLGVWSLVAAHLVQVTLRTALLLYVSPPRLLYAWRWREARQLLSFGGGSALDYLFNYAALQGDNVVVGRTLGASAVGIYGRAYQLAALPATLLGQVLDKVLFSAMSRSQDDRQHTVAAFRRSVSATAFAVIPLTAVCWVLAPELIRVLLGGGWEEAILPFQILTAGMFFRTGYKISNSFALAQGKVYQRALRQFVYMAAVLGGASFGVRFGVTGVAAAVLAAIALNYALMAQLALRTLRLGWRDFLLLHVPGLCMACALLLEQTGLVHALRAADVPDLAVVVLAASSAVPTLWLAYMLFPARLRSGEAQWTASLVLKAAGWGRKRLRIRPNGEI